MDSDRPQGEAPDPVPGLTGAKALLLDRFLIRTRGGNSTQSAWRLAVASAQGQGAIIFVEGSREETFYRGEGVFLGWPQDRLESAYRALLPKADESDLELNQLG